MLEKLHRTLVFLGGAPALEGAEVAAPACLAIDFP
jgi:hypothetical protein